MSTKLFSLFLLSIFIVFCSSAQVKESKIQTITLDNDVVKRNIVYNGETDGLYSVDYNLYMKKYEKPTLDTDFDVDKDLSDVFKKTPETVKEEKFLAQSAPEFSFELNGVKINSMKGWLLSSIESYKNDDDVSIKEIFLSSSVYNLKVKIIYQLFEGLPIIRKRLEIQNTGKDKVMIESPDIEIIDYSGSFINCWVMNDYARQKSLGQFIGTSYDPVVLVHHYGARRGIILGNEAPGVMKRTSTFLEPRLLAIGLTHSDDTFPFRKWLDSGETWESTWAFSGLYRDTDNPYDVLNETVSDYVRKHLGTRLSQIDERPVFVYNTWEPFRLDINEKLIYELVDAAAECGMEEFVIDDGWQTEYGDWDIDKKKFPNGLKPVFDYIKSKGMKPGVWISIAGASAKSNVIKEHPEWLVRKANGDPIYLHSDDDMTYGQTIYSMCMTSGWQNYIRDVIMNLIKEHGLQYLKGDFAVASGAYTTDKTRSGCHATNHPHADRNESLLEMYQATWQLFDDLHKEAPDLFIDCTFETMGAFQLIDLDMCKHAEGNWLSNFLEPAPYGSFRVRQMAWWRTPVIPATALVIGNQRVDDPEFELSLKSLIGSLPIVLGDPRKLSSEERARVKKWGEWLRKMEDEHQIMLFRQDLPGFGEPMDGAWDGYQRINTESNSGGIVGIFKNNTNIEEQFVTIKYLDPKASYQIFEAPGREIIAIMTGKELREKGFKVKLSKLYDGAVFEITRIMNFKSENTLK